MDDEAVSKIYEAKGRPSDNPLIVHFYEMNQLDSIVDYNDENVKKMCEFILATTRGIPTDKGKV